MATVAYSYDLVGGLTFLDNVSTAGDQSDVALAALANGFYLAAWTAPGNANVQGRVMRTDGTGATSEFDVNTTTASLQYDASVAGLTNGNGLIVFTDTSTDRGDLRGRLFSGSGAPLGNDFAVAVGGSIVRESSVAALPGGGFVVTYTLDAQVGDINVGDHDVRGQVLYAPGIAATNQLNISTTLSTINSELSSVAATSAGFVVAWQESPASGGDTEVYFRRYNAAGTPLDANPVLIDTAGSINRDIHVAGLADGGFAVAYTDNGYGAGTDITARSFNADGSGHSNFIRVNTLTSGDQNLASIAALPNGGFVVGFLDASSEYAQAYDANGVALGSNTALTGSVVEGELAVVDNHLVLARSSTLSESDGAGNSVRTSTYDFTRTVTGDSTSETLSGDGLRDVIKGAGGNDTINGGTNVNVLDGGAGDDTVVFDFTFASATLSGTTLTGNVKIEGSYASDILTGFEHFKFADGQIDQYDNNVLVDDLYYNFRNKDVFAAHIDADDHYFAYGYKDGRDPNAYFSVNGYLGANPDVKAAGLDPLKHYDAYGWRDGRDPSANFDTTLYLQHNADVKAAGFDPLAHFLSFGLAEGRQAYAAIGPASSFSHGSFDAEYYLLSNPDVAKSVPAGANVNNFAYNHYEAYGWHEGRNPNAYFDVNGYLNAYADVKAANIDPLGHYDTFGFRDGRDPSGAFDTKAYLAHNADVANAHVDPLLHYLQYGVYEGRSANADGTFFHV